MPPEIIDAIGPLSGGGVAAAIALVITKAIEAKLGMPQLEARLKMVEEQATREREHSTRLHSQCEERAARLEGRIDELLDRLSEPG